MNSGGESFPLDEGAFDSGDGGVEIGAGTVEHRPASDSVRVNEGDAGALDLEAMVAGKDEIESCAALQVGDGTAAEQRDRVLRGGEFLEARDRRLRDCGVVGARGD